MSFHSGLQDLRPAFAPSGGQRHHRRRGSFRAATNRPSLEVLEVRCVPAFLAPVDYGLTDSAPAIVTADFNSDGKLDLATVNPWGIYDLNGDLDLKVGVLFGNGDGTFQAPRYYDIGQFYLGIAAGDFNDDGKADLVIGTGDEYNATITLLLGNGDGSFRGAVSESRTGGESTQDLAVGDFDADGNLDVAVKGDSGYGSGGTVMVLRGRGDGTFAAGIFIGLSDVFPIATGDFNRDGRWDVASAAPVGVGVLFSNGVGTFDFAAKRYLTTDGTPSTSVAVADLNGDGKPDLVAGNSSGSTSVLSGNSDGTFQAARNYAESALVGDFNGDGSLDVLMGNGLLPGNGNDAGTLPAELGLYTLGDFNGDGLWDVAWAGGVVQLNDGIWDGPPPPLPSVPSITINDRTVTEGNTGTVAANFTVTLSAASTGAITVAYATGNGTGTAGSDFITTIGTVTFAPGETSKTVTVPVIGDRLAEPNETFVVNLSSPTNATVADGQGQGTILDDEPRISIGDVSKKEGNSGLTAFAFTVNLSVAYDVPMTVAYATANGTATAGGDYRAAIGTLTIPAGQTSGTITVQVIGDRLAEPNETFFVNLGNSNYGVITRVQGVGTILDDEPRISIGDVSKSEGKKGQTTLFTFTVTLSAAYDQPVTMSFRTVDGSAKTSDGDYVAQAGTLTFAAGETSKTITIPVQGDSKRESDETFYLDLFGNGSNSLLTKSRGLGTIRNDD